MKRPAVPAEWDWECISINETVRIHHASLRRGEMEGGGRDGVAMKTPRRKTRPRAARISTTARLFHCQGNVREATHPDGAGCSRRKIDHPSAYKRSPVIDGHHNGLAVSPTRDADS